MIKETTIKTTKIKFDPTINVLIDVFKDASLPCESARNIAGCHDSFHCICQTRLSAFTRCNKRLSILRNHKIYFLKIHRASSLYLDQRNHQYKIKSKVKAITGVYKVEPCIRFKTYLWTSISDF